ncbi:cryptochrome/photolyase family protein [Saccharopolyspora phatthalungensis]|uniref:Deoxyribodipyrimidine photo-lyase n=1 Tax=Saccharopolyspora phatthalungensis TaxID=664693 RepID=A0A840PZA3_9PSEU|nr:deoxyribodipyrimidine photo-lyase [Saccharopolyspora phatthalungensis]MBB5152551.1 deoxyribodipyrimidine photo-lyase [Saccharopolyspora phatthalungensis]
MRTAISLFTRDLRVHDSPVLRQAAEADRVVPLFVFDEQVLSSRFNRPNRMAFLLDCLRDLDRSLRDLGGKLVIRRGDPVAEVAELVDSQHATEVHIARDVSTRALTREQELHHALTERDCSLHVHDAVITAQPPGRVVPVGNDHFAVFTPFFRRWAEFPLRPVLAPPRAIRLPSGIRTSRLPARSKLCAGDVSPRLPSGGERSARDRVRQWFDAGIGEYSEGHDDLAGDATSRLSPYLHFGCISPVELIEQCGPSEAERDFVRQLAWREFHHQVLAARPACSHRDYRPRQDRWRHDPQALQAWRDGRTGIPIVDAGMRQLAWEGWMHNRARLITASFLTKTLHLDWRLGAQHFLDLLVDGDIANNNMNWQWVAGTGTDTRPNRVLNPMRQAARYDPNGDYVRKYVPELSGLPVRALHEPHRISADELADRGYPAPIVDVDEANARFRQSRGKL